MGSCIYERVIAIYHRTQEGNLLGCFGKHEDSVHSEWTELREKLHPHTINSYRSLFNLSLNGDAWHCDVVNIHEAPSAGSGPIVGIILCPARKEHSMAAFDEFFARTSLSYMSPRATHWELPEDPMNASLAEKVVDLCNAELLVHPPNSQWHLVGRDYLIKKVSFFILRNLPIQMCLPAFPCKSSNREKVAGADPDRGEELALRRLYSVLRKIERVYSPGARLCIVSDGHVFSDCSETPFPPLCDQDRERLIVDSIVGVDDEQVDKYGYCLQELNRAIETEEKQLGQIKFQSLKDIFPSTPEQLLGKKQALQIEFPSVNHFLDTRVTPDTEFCRQAMMLAGQFDRSALRKLIEGQDSAALSLYRGFSRFMLEDLALHPQSVSMSRSQRKKTAGKISFEMLLRNQAYSNLVELLFPDHIRLSIHAHINSGPKFGITLFDPAKTRVIDSLENLSSVAELSHDLLHIPTPWHNCVFQFSQSDLTFITKSKVIYDARKLNQIQVRWVQPDITKASGGFFETEPFESSSEDLEVATPKPIAKKNPIFFENITPTIKDVSAVKEPCLRKAGRFTLFRLRTVLRYGDRRWMYFRKKSENVGM